MGSLVGRWRVRLVVGGGGNVGVARPIPDRVHMGRRGRFGSTRLVRAAGVGRADGGRSTARARRGPRRPSRHPPADAAGNRRSRACRQPDRRDLHPDLLRVRCPRHRVAPRRLWRQGPDHGRRLPAPGGLDRSQVRRGRRGRAGPHHRAPPRGTAGGRGPGGSVAGGERSMVGTSQEWRHRPWICAGPRPRARPRDALHGHLHIRHDRPAEGRGPRPRRLPDQGRPGPRPHVRPDRARHVVLVHGPRLDDGSLGDRRGPAARRPAASLRGCARLPRPGPPLGER